MENWARWIFASASKHFQAAADAASIHMYIEGLDRQTDEYPKWWEFRMDGPSVDNRSHNYYRLDVEINMLWSADLTSTDFHEPMRQIGLLQQAMTDICVHRYGDGPNDDNSLLGVLTLVQDAGNPIRTVQFGKVRTDTNIVQGTVESTYRMHLTSEELT